MDNPYRSRKGDTILRVAVLGVDPYRGTVQDVPYREDETSIADINAGLYNYPVLST